jgi:predicted AlkP superfamily pyrophosphatase or phosphodiesterase
MAVAPLVLIDAVGLTPRLLKHAPRLAALAKSGWSVPLREVIPAVTSTAQATLLTGEQPDVHGVVANGWLYRDTHEVRFWQQSNRLLQAEPIYVTARRRAVARGREFRCAKLFWWFNQGAAVDFSVTPKPHYGVDGQKVFDVLTYSVRLGQDLVRKLGPFPFASFWGPKACLASTTWIARAAAATLERHRPDLSLVYLPHLDYDPQRCGPAGCDIAKLVGELDRTCAPLLDAAKSQGARVWVVNEYCHHDVSTPIYPNKALREAGFRIMQMLLTGDLINADTAMRFGLINEVAPEAELGNRTAALAAKIASKSPLILAMGKEAFYRQADIPLAEAYAFAAEVMVTNLSRRDAQEGIGAFIDKRSPVWCGQ